MGPHRQRDRDRQDERRQALRLAQGHAGENSRRASRQPHRQTPLLELHPAVKLKAGGASQATLTKNWTYYLGVLRRFFMTASMRKGDSVTVPTAQI